MIHASRVFLVCGADNYAFKHPHITELARFKKQLLRSIVAAYFSRNFFIGHGF